MSMKGQFFVITAVVMISFLVLIYSTVNFQSTGAAYIYSTNDHFVLNNILSEYSFMLRLD